MDAKERLTIARILKVNHAGEYGAIRIYRAQLWLARKWYPDLVPFLEETLAHEISHCSLFFEAMPEREARPCRIMSLWSQGGYVLGLLTALMGRQGIWVCTAAVEATVHRHLEDQLRFVEQRDPELHELILSIQVEELQHLHHAEERLDSPTLWSRSVNAVIVGATEAVIWLSTWGDSSRMAKALEA